MRSGTASAWTTANPTLDLGEPGVETDTGQWKIGTGVTAWNSLAYAGTTGPTQTTPYRSLGDGSDGSVTISSGTTVLSRDMYYNNLTVNGTGSLNTNGYKIFIKSVLDLTAAPANAIQWNGNAGGNASGATGGTQAAAQTGATLGDISQGGAGVTATTGAGTGGASGSAVGTGLGGIGGTSGRGGSGGSGNPAAATGGRSPVYTNNYRRYETLVIHNGNLVSGGGGGASGSAGSGDGTNVGGGSGGGGNGGGSVAIYANVILKSSATAAGCISANGGMGGNGGNGAAAGNTGGGGAGGGGAGGWVYLCYQDKYGPIVPNMLTSNGGQGGIGGNGFGTGTGGDGGSSGFGGRVTTFKITTGVGTEIYAPSSNTFLPELSGSNAFGIMISGGTGGSVAYSQQDF